MELPRPGPHAHPWFIGVQYHPEFKSTPRDGHPLFTAFIKAANRQQTSPRNKRKQCMKLCGFEIGLDKPFFLIAGPCVIESRQLAIDTAGALKEMTSELGIPFIYKSSYDKANRSSSSSFRGPGMEKGLDILAMSKTVQYTGIDRCSYRIGNRAGRPNQSTSCKHRLSCAARQTSSKPVPVPASPSISKRTVPCSGRHDKRCEKSERGCPGSPVFRKTVSPSVNGERRSAITIWFPICVPVPSSANGLPVVFDAHPFGPVAGRTGRCLWRTT